MESLKFWYNGCHIPPTFAVQRLAEFQTFNRSEQEEARLHRFSVDYVDRRTLVDLRRLSERLELEESAMDCLASDTVTTVDTSATLGLRVLPERLKPDESRRPYEILRKKAFYKPDLGSLCASRTPQDGRVKTSPRDSEKESLIA
ncbi:hypothetical protein BKA70DRAFT_1430921 [Coprinopsis sp. MPI-PUGE-AT-0042]|nr:hypothetical protein BKA70DRAFT_1430921 [Coprinopsis sp. MPI-PUGE-AT-0042]